MNKFLASKWTKAAVFLLGLVPLAYLIVWRGDLPHRGAHANLTANPIEYITHFTGDWTIRFLLITLSITPLRKIFNRPQFTRFRRMLGLFAFFYGMLHFSVWIWLDKNFDGSEMWTDIWKRKFITIGMLGLSLMVPLAVTSTAGWVRRLGYKRWQRLHRAVYFSASAGVVHYYWLVKSDIRLPVMYGAILVVLMAFRIQRKKSKPARQAPQPRPAVTAS
jgi:methionine sulfoxide reductase heme-binding subunit